MHKTITKEDLITKKKLLQPFFQIQFLLPFEAEMKAMNSVNKDDSLLSLRCPR